MSGRLQKSLLLLLAGVLLLGAGLAQRALNDDRDRLGLTRVAPLDNAPPVLAFTTVALGGFRGLISNALWMRANDLQDQDKFFEMVQLADWITKLEPHFVMVWVNQAWNMAYNISVKFKENSPGLYPDRWRWVRSGIELLRDQGLRYNPNELLLYRELAWFYQHKMGQDLDDANMYYKQRWADEMATVFGKGKPNLDELITPQTDDAKARARLLREQYKMDPKLMQELDTRYGALEWRLPEAHAIYWATVGLQKAQENPTKVNKDDLIQLRRVIYQSLLLSMHRGRLVADPFAKRFEFGPNLAVIPALSAAYEQAMGEDDKMRDNIRIAHRNALKDAVYYLYEYNRKADASRWYDYLAKTYPTNNVIDGEPKSYASVVPVDEYALWRIQQVLGETSRKDMKGALEGLFVHAYRDLALGEDERCAGYKLLAKQAYDHYAAETAPSGVRVALPPLPEIDVEIRNRVLDPVTGFPFEARQIIRTKLRLPLETPPASSTNAPPAGAAPSTNAPPAKAASG
jgi:hypothetical protein